MRISPDRRRAGGVSPPRDWISRGDSVVVRGTLSLGGLTPPARRRRCVRDGITLFEVVVAMVIFALTLPALNALVEIGTRRAEESTFIARASMECRSKLAEFTVGAEPLDSNDWTPLSDPNWYWKANVAGGDVDGLKNVQVSVKYDLGVGPATKVTLSQIIIDPSMRGSTQDRSILAGILNGNQNNSMTPSDNTANNNSTTPNSSSTPAIPNSGAGGLGSLKTGNTGAGATGKSGTSGVPSGAIGGSGASGSPGASGAFGAAGAAGMSGRSGAAGASGASGSSGGKGGSR